MNSQALTEVAEGDLGCWAGAESDLSPKGMFLVPEMEMSRGWWASEAHMPVSTFFCLYSVRGLCSPFVEKLSRSQELGMARPVYMAQCRWHQDYSF